MLLMVQKGIRGWICHAIHRYAEVVQNIWTIMIKVNNHYILIIGM